MNANRPGQSEKGISVMPTPKTVQFLIIDDISAIRDMLKQHLKELGYTGIPHEAASIGEANTLVEKSISGEIPKIEYILSDWNLPDDTGLTFLKKVRGISHFDSVPHIMITTENEITHMLDAVAAGSNNYVVKPWTKEELGEKIDSSWDTMAKQKSKTSTNISITPPSPPPPPPQDEEKTETETAIDDFEEDLTPSETKITKVNIRAKKPSSKKSKKGKKKVKKSFWQKLFGK